MKKNGWTISLMLCLVLLDGRSASACTIVMASKDGAVLVGNNEDFGSARTRVFFFPAQPGRYGCVLFGFDGAPQGGMNDQGLFIDANAVKPTGWQAQPGKPGYIGFIFNDILYNCASVAEVQAWFEKYNVWALAKARFPVADRSGASMVVEYAQGQVRFVKEPGWFQVSTNFLRSEHPGQNVPCNRFQLAEQLMGTAGKLDLPLLRSVLSATHQEGDNPTVYSIIYDLKNGMITLYHFHNFEEAVVLNLAEELKKGERSLELPSLFKVQPHVAKVFIDQQIQPSYPVLVELYEKEGAAAALSRYEQMRREVRWISRHDIGEDQIVKLADYIQSKGDHRTALALYHGLSRSFPDSLRAREGISRIHVALGNKAEAITSLQRLLELDPENQWARQTLEQLKKKTSKK
jgi:tetratricopeptide (TPR) repeat protein